MAKWVTFPYRIYYKKKKPYFHMKKKLQTCHSIWITSKSIWTNNDQKFRTMFWFTFTYRVTSNSICVDAVFLLDHQLSCYIRHPSAIEVKRNKSKQSRFSNIHKEISSFLTLWNEQRNITIWGWSKSLRWGSTHWNPLWETKGHSVQNTCLAWKAPSLYNQ